jgi:F0F1-type ATP synthase gamma subunit
MKLVSTVKLQKARTKAEQTTPYFNAMYNTICSMLAKAGNVNNRYLQDNGSDKIGVIVITSNRGLAGGYNSNVVKLITNSDFKNEDLDIYALGSKGYDALSRRGYNIKENRSDIMDDPTYEDAMKLCRTVLDSFAKGEIGEIYLAYTHFKNTVTHIPTLIKLLPVDTEGFEEAEVDDNVMMNFEPNTEEALKYYIKSHELGMPNMTTHIQNACEKLNKLSLYFEVLSASRETTDTDLLNELAYCYAQGIGTNVNLNMAHTIIDRAIQIKPNYAFLYDSKGEFFMLAGDRKNALKMYKKVMKLDPTFYISYPNTVLYDYVNKK